MRKVRDYDAELKALSDKAKTLKARRVEQLGSLVAVTDADVMDPQMLAGILLDAVETNDANVREAWRAKGASFFQNRSRKAGRSLSNTDSDGASQSGRSSSLDGATDK